MPRIDHMILPVNELAPVMTFYCDLLGFASEGDDGPFSVVRVSDDFFLLLSPFGTTGGLHLAFAYDESGFDHVVQRIKDSGAAYGDNFDSVGNMRGPALQRGARGDRLSLYVNDPNKHLIEVRRS